MEEKTIKQYAKEAKLRLKSRFWQNYIATVREEMEKAQMVGVPVSKVKEYYEIKVNENIKNPDEKREEFYQKVKELLDNEGEVSNAIGRLTDRPYFDTLTYEEKQRYTLKLSEDYLKAVERYKKEKSMAF